MGSITPHTSFAAVLTKPTYGAPYTFTSCQYPSPPRHHATIRLDFSGVCHGDVYSRDGGGPAPADPVRPLVGGHEGIGEIVELGDGSGDEWMVGDVVGIAWRRAVCGSCDACNVGRDNHCEQQVINGLHCDGTFQRYLSFPTAQLIRIPHCLSPVQGAPLLCAGVTSYTSLRLMNPVAGRWCVIVGAAGGLGHLAIQYAKTFGLKVVAIDGGQRDKKESFCRRMGCDLYVDYLEAGDDLVVTVKNATAGGADYVVVLSPHQSAYTAAGEYARFKAQIMCVGIGRCHFPLRPILKKDLTIRSNETGTKADIEACMQLSAAGKVKCEVEVMGILKLNEAMDRVKLGGVLGKLVLDLRVE